MTDDHTLYEEAESQRQAGNLLEAGDLYSRAAHLTCGKGIYPSSGGELKHFLEAATCYRIAGRMDRCRNRCRMGVLRAEDISDRALSKPTPEHDLHRANRGMWKEAIGMLRLVGELPGSDDAYQEAFDVYRNAGDPKSHREEPPRTTVYTWFTGIERAATGAVTKTPFRRDRTYTEYATYIKNKIPEYLESLEERGEWRPPEETS